MGTSAAAITSLAKALLPSSCAACSRGAEAGDAPRADGVGDTCDQRCLGPDDDEVGPELDREAGYRVTVERVDLVEDRQAADAGIARCGVRLGDVGVTGQGQDEGVLAGAGADDENLHAAEPKGAPTTPAAPTPLVIMRRCAHRPRSVLLPPRRPFRDHARMRLGSGAARTGCAALARRMRA